MRVQEFICTMMAMQEGELPFSFLLSVPGSGSRPAKPLFEGQKVVRVSEPESEETKEQNRVTQRSAEILPEGSMLSGEVGRKQQGEHVDRSKRARRTNQDSKEQSEADRQFTVSGQKSERGGMREHKVAQDRRHEGIGAALEKSFDPSLKPAAENKSCAENLVLAEDQKKHADRDAQSGKHFGIAIDGCKLS